MSRRARERQEAHEAKRNPGHWEYDNWRQDRRDDDKPPPDREEPEPVNTLH